MNTVFNLIFTGNFKLCYLSFNIDCCYLKGKTIVNNLTACLIFIKCHTYNVNDCIGKVFF